MGLLLKNALVVLGGYNLSGDMNSLALSYKAAALDDTRFGDNTNQKIGGLKDIAISCKGFWDTGTDAELFNDVGQGDIMTMASLPAEGTVAFFLKVLDIEYQIGTTVGDNMPFSLTADAQSNLIRGLLGANKSGITASGNGTGFNLGAVGAGQSLWASLHVLSVAGTTPSMTMAIQGDSSDAFAEPTTVLTFDAATGIGAQFMSVEGALAETWYQPIWTITGTDPVFAFILAMGVQ
ncbi:MAG: hypothetical protein WBR15_02805 [Gammaproteobacteria bacterium]